MRSPDSSREILRAIGVDQHLRTSAPCRAVRLSRYIPDLLAGKLPLKLAPTLAVAHGLSSIRAQQHAHSPGHEYPPHERVTLAFAYARTRRPASRS